MAEETAAGSAATAEAVAPPSVTVLGDDEAPAARHCDAESRSSSTALKAASIKVRRAAKSPLAAISLTMSSIVELAMVSWKACRFVGAPWMVLANRKEVDTSFAKCMLTNYY